jgi:hypothetical protein
MKNNRFIAKSLVRMPDGTLDLDKTNQKYEALVLAAYDDELTAAEALAKKTHDANIEAFGTDLQEYLKTRAKWDEMSAKHINAAFARFAHTTKGGCIAKGVLINMTTAAMLAAAEIGILDVKKASEMVLSYIDDNKGVIFSIEAGSGGGVRLLKSEEPIRA